MRNNGEDFSSKIEKFLRSDTKARFVKLLQDHPSEVTNSLVNQCVDHGAKKCLFALLCGEVCGQFPTLDADVPESGVTCLAYVAHSDADPEVINLMLTRCGAIPLVNVPCTIGSIHGLPIHFLLVNLSFLDHIYHWVRGESILKLVMLLCQWNTKPILDCVRLLAQHTDSINDIAWIFLMNQGLEQFVALLLVAQEKVMAPFDSGLIIHQRIAREIDSLSEGDISSDKEEYKCVLEDALQLLNVFERAGKDLSLYCSSMQNRVPVEKGIVDVCGFLQKSGIHVSYYDLNLSPQFFTYRGLQRLDVGRIAGPYDGPCLHIRPARCTSWPSCYDPYTQGGGRNGRNQIPVPKLVSSLGSQPKLYSTIACHSRSFFKSLPLAGSGASPRQLANFTMKLTRAALKFL